MTLTIPDSTRRKPICRVCHTVKLPGHARGGPCKRAICTDVNKCKRPDLHVNLSGYIPVPMPVDEFDNEEIIDDGDLEEMVFEYEPEEQQENTVPVPPPIVNNIVPTTVPLIVPRRIPCNTISSSQRSVNSLQFSELQLILSTMQHQTELMLEERKQREERDNMMFRNSIRSLERLIYFVLGSILILIMILLIKS